jgi:hypothetical protein
MKNPGKNDNFTYDRRATLKVFSTGCSGKYLAVRRGSDKRVHNYELQNHYFSLVTSFIIVIKSRKMAWAEYVVRMKDMRMTFKNLVENPEVK